MTDSAELMWSNTDYPYICLIDRKRTLAFKKSIEATVKEGDVVLEVGAGTGILSLIAASSGASKVYAVELDPILAESFRKTVEINHLSDVIEVIEGDALEVDLPDVVDVVIGELVETALIDEMQVIVMNTLRKNDVITQNTKLILGAYESFVELVEVDNKYFGYELSIPIHDWPYYSKDPEEWEQVSIKAVSERQTIGSYDFQAGIVDPKVDRTITFEIPEGAKPNAIRLSGVATMSDGSKLGAFNSFNGDKILPMDILVKDNRVELHLRYEMSMGFKNFTAEVL